MNLIAALEIKKSGLGEGIVCLGEGSGGKGGGKSGKGKWGKRGREVGVMGREVGSAYPHPPTPVHPLIVKIKDILDPVHGVFRRKCAALVVPFAGTNGAFRRKMVGERFENADKSRTDSSPIQGESSFKEKCTSCLQSNGRTVMWIQIHPCPYFYLCPYLPGCTLLVSSVLSWDITACLRSLISQLWTIFTNISAMTLSYCFCYGRSTSVQIFC